MSKSSEKNKNQATKKAEEPQAAPVEEEKVASKEADSTSAEETKDTDSAAAEEQQEENDRVEGRAWQVAQLAAQMVSRDGIFGRLDNKEWRGGEELQIARITEAVRAARLVLDVASQPVDEMIRASTLFTPGEALNPPAIAKRFGDVGWPGLGITKVRQRFREIGECWERSISFYHGMANRLESGNDAAIRKIADSLAALAGDVDVFCTIVDFQERASNLLSEIRKEVSPPPESATVSADRLQSLYGWCFPDDPPKKTKENELWFRAHELLRFAEVQYEERIGSARRKHRFHEISDDVLEGEVREAELWLPGPLRPRPLKSLTPPYNRSAFNSPPTQKDSFKAYNQDRESNLSLQYPW